MSLVDYASSDDNDDIIPENLADEHEKASHHIPQSSTHRSQKLSESKEDPETVNSIGQPSIEKLPDASELLSSPDFSSNNALGGTTDHSSLVAAAVAQSASRKRDSTVTLPSSLPRSKFPKGTLPHSKNVPETVSGLLAPPQLRGRSNIVTEDISKLFVKKQVQTEPAPK